MSPCATDTIRVGASQQHTGLLVRQQTTLPAQLVLRVKEDQHAVQRLPDQHHRALLMRNGIEADRTRADLRKRTLRPKGHHAAHAHEEHATETRKRQPSH